MKRNGFTLIELLAVIVILAIIALIATPIILGIINDARKESQERSVELYASAIKNAIASYQLTHPNAPEKFSDLDIQYDGEVECAKEELYEDGSFYLTDCIVNGNTIEYAYGTKQEKVAKLSEVCTIASDSIVQGLNMGAKYNCKVDPNKPAYTFYVLNTPTSEADSVNLILNSNITSTGVAITEENPSDIGVVEWISLGDLEEYAPQEDIDNWENLNIYGPITAMNYLQIATSGWTKVNQQTVSTFTKCPYGGDACTDEELAETFTVNARMPYLSEIGLTGCDITGDYTSRTCPTWMVDYLLDSGINGYWILSSSSNFEYVWYVSGSGSAYEDTLAINNVNGVRPVINLSI